MKVQNERKKKKPRMVFDIYFDKCVKDTSNDPENDVFFAVAFRLEEKLDQFSQDWFKATPYMSSCKFSI